ncbi:MAG TPA: beta-ketoacyl synthase N-terminal-like domain-containing protein [Methylomirabilota bacterium]|nr:beta-ketoacyl synthase N-terminal-like domain-containing protein [Methylomirabilota bacterium]
MSRIFIHGLGAVSPGGWNVENLRAAWKENVPLPVQDLPRPGWNKPLQVRNVPPPTSRPAFLAHPRLRRATAVAQYTVAAALEAIGGDAAQIQSGDLRLGIVVCALSGSVNYSRRFYEEVLREPATASPLIFPETVFNSAASHLGAFLGVNAINYTLVGDDGTFLQGLALAANWIAEEKVDACIVVGAEENDWIVSDAIQLFQRKTVHAAGAGAIYLKKNFSDSAAKLVAVTDSFSFTQKQSRVEAARKMRAQLPPCAGNELFSDEKVKTIFGEAFTASAAWRCVLACNAIRRNELSAANVEIVGINQQAIGARFVKAN